MGRPQLVHVLPGLGLGGAERILLTWLGESRASYHNTVLAPRGGALVEAAKACGAEVQVGARPCLSTALVRRAPTAVMGWLHHGNAAAAALQQTLWPKARLVCSHHGGPHAGAGPWHQRLARKLEAWTHPLAHAHLYVAAATARAAFCEGRGLRRAWRLPVGIDTKTFRPDPWAKLHLRMALHLAAEPQVVGLVGRYDPVKAHGRGLQAFLRQAQPHQHLVMLGHGIHPLPNALAAQILPRQRHQIHTLPPRQAGMAQVLAGLDALLLSSSSEALPLVVLEAMACAVPCATTAVGDLATLFADGGGPTDLLGWTAPTTRVDLLADALHKALACGRVAAASPTGAAALRLRANRAWVQHKHGKAELVRTLGRCLDPQQFAGP